MVLRTLLGLGGRSGGSARRMGRVEAEGDGSRSRWQGRRRGEEEAQGQLYLCRARVGSAEGLTAERTRKASDEM